MRGPTFFRTIYQYVRKFENNLKWLTSGSNSVRSESAFAGTLIVFNAWNSASFIKLLTRLSSDIGTL